MADHAARAHAAWSASASVRNWRCPGAMALIDSLGIEDKETRAAAWGTACHQVAEHCLRDEQDAADFIGRTVSTAKFRFEFDVEMAETTQAFLDYVRGRLAEYREATGRDDAILLIEQKFDLAPIKPPMPAGGTGDAVLLFPAWGLIEIVDLKTGMGWVAADENLQLRTYALGAMLANPGQWRRVRATIVQPRVGNGAPRWEEVDLSDLLDWTLDLKAAMDMSAAASRAAALGDKRPRSWEADYLRPGDHCDKTFCPARAACPALQTKALEAAQTFFEPEGGVATPPDPKSLPVEKVVAILDAADMIEGWLNAVRAYGRELVESGREVGPYILVPKRAMRKWKEEDQTALLNDLTCATGILPDDLFERKIKSPAQVEKLLGKKNVGKIADLVTQESSGTNLVRSDKTTREAVRAPVLSLFTKET